MHVQQDKLLQSKVAYSKGFDLDSIDRERLIKWQHKLHQFLFLNVFKVSYSITQQLKIQCKIKIIMKSMPLTKEKK